MKKTALLLPVLVLLALSGPAEAAAPVLTIVKDPQGLPRPFNRIAVAGDILITDGRVAAVIAATPRPLWSSINYGHPEIAGYVAAFLPAGCAARPEAQMGYPAVRIKGRAVPIAAAGVRIEGPYVVARAAGQGPDGARLEILVRYAFFLDAGRIDAAVEIRNAGPGRIEGLSAGLGATAWQSYSFSPFDAASLPRLNVRVYERPDHALAWQNPNPVETAEKPFPGSLGPGRAVRLGYSIYAAKTVPELLDRIYRRAAAATVRAGLELKGVDGPHEVTVREAASGTVFFRTFRAGPAPLAFPLPPGTYSVRANLFPAVVERTLVAAAGGGAGAVAAWKIEAPPRGRLRVVLSDRRGRPVPGKVVFIGLSPTGSPYFEPMNPIVTGRSFEGRKNAVYPPPEGLEMALPAGTYLAVGSRGPEFEQDSRVVEVLAGESRELRLAIGRAVETPGLVSVDPHMHTQFSDGSVGVAERLRSAAAEGLDAVVSADHNAITDYGPELEHLRLAGELSFVPGYEVTARTGSLHFNSWPADVRPGEPGQGSVPVVDETPAALFALARAKNPGSLVELNHPRSGGLGYFNNYDLEPDKAASAKAPFDPGFDVLEALNGAKPDKDNLRAVEDWFHLLNRGYAVRIVGSSDAHGVDGGETGYARTYVLMDEPDPGRPLDAAALAAAIKKGRAFVSNGPVVYVRAGRRATFGDTVRARRGRVDLDIAVTGAPWLDVSEVRLVVNGERRPPLPIKGSDGRTIKFRDRVRVPFDHDGWIVVEVLGRRSLYPLVQQTAGDGRPGDAARPYALTNPIFVDAGGDGRLDPVWPEKVVVK